MIGTHNLVLRISRIVTALAVAISLPPAVARAEQPKSARAVEAAPAPAGAERPLARDPLAPLVSEALANNLEFASARLAERRASAELTAARTQWLPSVRLETRASKLDDVQDLGALINPAYEALNRLTGTRDFPTDLSLTLPRQYESHLRVTQPLIHEPLRASVSIAGAGRDAARAARGAAARRLAAEVQIAYLRHASALRVVRIEESALNLVQENERVAGKLLAAGRATPEAVHRARADRAEVAQQLDDARVRASAAARELNRVAGRADGAPVEDLPDSSFDLPLGVGAEEAVRSALTRREELAQADAGSRAARAAVRAATGTFLPNVSAAFDLAYQGERWGLRSKDRSWSASLVASWDLFRGGSDLARRAAARAGAERAELDRRDAAERIAVEVRNAHEAARVGRDALATADTRADAARHTYSMVRRRYEEGTASPLELTAARTQLTTAEINRVLTLYRYAILRVDLERAAALRDLPAEKGDLR
ncbi:MAG: TolC family protein [Candidatus Eisenbacteria bacterium]|nr:TolC family protein [Candidatus Eisenbacteria bacterium]